MSPMPQAQAVGHVALVAKGNPRPHTPFMGLSVEPFMMLQTAGAQLLSTERIKDRMAVSAISETRVVGPLLFGAPLLPPSAAPE